MYDKPETLLINHPPNIKIGTKLFKLNTIKKTGFILLLLVLTNSSCTKQ